MKCSLTLAFKSFGGQMLFKLMTKRINNLLYGSKKIEVVTLPVL